MARICLPLALWTTLLVLPASAAERSSLQSPPEASPPAGSSEETWRRAQELEHAGRLEESAGLFEQVVLARPADAQARWRLSRTYWRIAERLPTEDVEGRMEYFQNAERSAREGLEVDPECAPCMLWRAASLGRIATTGGMVSAARTAPVIADLLERGIELEPRDTDGPMNSTLGNLYLAAAAFYRLVPDWFWLKWVIGVRGDKERAVEYGRRAVEINSARVDYNVELGAGLLCLGTSRSRPERVAEGLEVLRRTQSLPQVMDTDAVDVDFARLLMQEPERACSFARDGFVDLEEAELRRSKQGKRPKS